MVSNKPGSRAHTSKAGTEVLPEGKAKPTCLRLEDVRRSLLEKPIPWDIGNRT